MLRIKKRLSDLSIWILHTLYGAEWYEVDLLVEASFVAADTDGSDEEYPSVSPYYHRATDALCRLEEDGLAEAVERSGRVIIKLTLEGWLFLLRLGDAA